jgi:hypothetical protein
MARQVAAGVVAELERLFQEHGAPLVVKCDNGSPLIAKEVGALLVGWGGVGRDLPALSSLLSAFQRVLRARLGLVQGAWDRVHGGAGWNRPFPGGLGRGLWAAEQLWLPAPPPGSQPPGDLGGPRSTRGRAAGCLPERLCRSPGPREAEGGRSGRRGPRRADPR